MKTVRRSALLGLLGAVTAAAFPGPALARGGRRARFSSGGAARHGAAAHAGPVMSREQLGSCLADQTAIEQKSGALEQAMASLSEDRTRLTEMEQRLSDEKRLVVPSSPTSVSRYDAVVERYRKMVDDYNEKLAPFKVRLAEIEAAQKRFNGQCANQAYDEADMQALLAKR